MCSLAEDGGAIVRFLWDKDGCLCQLGLQMLGYVKDVKSRSAKYVESILSLGGGRNSELSEVWCYILMCSVDWWGCLPAGSQWSLQWSPLSRAITADNIPCSIEWQQSRIAGTGRHSARLPIFNSKVYKTVVVFLCRQERNNKQAFIVVVKIIFHDDIKVCYIWWSNRLQQAARINNWLALTYSDCRPSETTCLK